MRQLIMTGCLCGMLGLFSFNAPAVAIYNVVDLGGNATATAVNQFGQVAGSLQTSNGNTHAAFWDNGNCAPVDLGTLGGSNSAAIAINNLGQIVGWSQTASNAAQHAAIWNNSSSPPIDLGTLPGGGDSQANGINDHGQIAGWSQTGSPDVRAVLWNNSASLPIDLGTLGGDSSSASAINNSTQIAGYAELGGFDDECGIDFQHAALWQSTNSVSDLGNLFVSGPSYCGIPCAGFSYADAVNSLGQAVGHGYLNCDDQGDYYAFSYATGAHNLGNFGGYDSSALGINTGGLIVGWASYTYPSVAAIWYNGGSTSPTDLNTLIDTNSGWTLALAYGINDSGEIVGSGDINGAAHAFALFPALPSSVSIAIQSPNVVLSFPSVSNSNYLYSVQSTTDLVSGAWSTIASNVPGSGGIVTNINMGAAATPTRFYRVGVLPAQ